MARITNKKEVAQDNPAERKEERNFDTSVSKTEMHKPVTNNINKSKIGPKKLAIIILLILAIFGSYGSIHFYNKYQEMKKNPNVEAQKETERLVGILGELMELPKDEIPTVATISDKDKLKGQAFFDNALNGDILFAYTTSMKAILYRPKTNKIINVAPISINQGQSISGGTVKTATTTKK